MCTAFTDTQNSCKDENGTPPEHWNTQSKTKRYTRVVCQIGVKYAFYRFGYCEPYSGSCELCNEIFRESIDYVFIAAVHGSQQNITSFIDNEIPPYLKSTSFEEGDECYKNMLRVICNYYLIPCGTESLQVPPYSICSEDCFAVERHCPGTWRTVKHSLENYNFISCQNTSNFIFPLPSCCTSVGIELPSKTGMCTVLQC